MADSEQAAKSATRVAQERWTFTGPSWIRQGRCTPRGLGTVSCL